MSISIHRIAQDGRSSRGLAAALLLAAAMIILVAASAPAFAKSAATIKRASLSGSSAYSAVNGEAKWKTKGGEREFELEIQDAKKLAGKTLTVSVGGKRAGQMKVSSLGRARLVKTGQSAPATITGKRVRITTAGGALVASGRF